MGFLAGSARRGAVIWALGVCAAFAGCAHQFPDYPSRRAAGCSYYASGGAVAWGVEPVLDATTSSTYFDVDLPAKGVLAVYVVVENQGVTPGVLVTPERFELRSGTRMGDPNAPVSKGPGMATMWTAVPVAAIAPVASFALLYIGAGMATSADNVQTNLRLKELRPQSLAPGQTVSGFLYFKIPDGPRQASRTLYLQTGALNASESRVLEVSFPLRKEQP